MYDKISIQSNKIHRAPWAWNNNETWGVKCFSRDPFKFRICRFIAGSGTVLFAIAQVGGGNGTKLRSPFYVPANLVIVNNRRLLSPSTPLSRSPSFFFFFFFFFSRPHARARSSDAWFRSVFRASRAALEVFPRLELPRINAMEFPPSLSHRGNFHHPLLLRQTMRAEAWFWYVDANGTLLLTPWLLWAPIGA